MEYKIIQSNAGEWAVFKRVKYPSGDTSFWQQVTKWYYYKKYCKLFIEKMEEKNHVR